MALLLYNKSSVPPLTFKYYRTGDIFKKYTRVPLEEYTPEDSECEITLKHREKGQQLVQNKQFCIGLVVHAGKEIQSIRHDDRAYYMKAVDEHTSGSIQTQEIRRLTAQEISSEVLDPLENETIPPVTFTEISINLSHSKIH